MGWTFTKGSLSIMIWKILTNRIVIFWKNFPMKWCYRKKEEIPIVTIMLHAATQHCDSRKWFFFCENFTSIKNVHILHTIYIHLQCFVSFLCIHYPNRFLMYTFAHTILLFFRDVHLRLTWDKSNKDSYSLRQFVDKKFLSRLVYEHLEYD